MIHGLPLSQRRQTGLKCILWLLQMAFMGVGSLLLAERQFELQLAVGAISHFAFMVMTVCDHSSKTNDELLPTWLPWLETIIGFSAFAISIGFLWVPHKTAAQCLVCMITIAPRGFRDWRKACDYDLVRF